MFLNSAHHTTTGDVNEVCSYLITDKKYDVVMSVIPTKNKLSIRASDHAEQSGLHVGEVCQSFFEQGWTLDGGGHAKAGGASYETDDDLEKICESLSDKITELHI
jgi:nanoRNase/pAp phosphatase (c-di-AMP/oligoRNAs hydrolase)